MNKNKIYEQLMRKCIALAKKAKGKNIPNPYVGALIYDEQEDKIISFGYHKKYGEAHAEVNAIKNANGNTKNKTIVVNLEPCSHWGKTPPCTDLIIKSGIKKCVIASYDKNKKASGGAQILKKAGIEVVSGILEKEALELNKVFFKNILYKKPYITLKTATTLDAKISLENGKSKWITNEKARNYVQKLRSDNQAIMSASGTILADNPQLNVRIKNKKSPIRIIFDPNNKIPLSYNVFKEDNTRIILINNSNITTPSYIEKIDFDGNFDNLFKKLYKMGIYSILIEAGCGFNSILLKSKEIDEIYHFIAPKIFGCGKNFVNDFELNEIEDCIELKEIKIKQLDDNLIINGKMKK